LFHSSKVNGPSVNNNDTLRNEVLNQNVESQAGQLTSDRTTTANALMNQPSVLAQTTSTVMEQLVSNSQRYMGQLATDTFHEQMTELVMHELRIDLVHELHRHFKTSQVMQNLPSDLQQKSIRTSVSCPLHTFSNLAKKIRDSSCHDSVHFFPTYAHTQNPSISSERFTIYFSTIHALSSAIGFNDDRDFETTHFRENCPNNTYYSRIIGPLANSCSMHSECNSMTKLSSTASDERKTCITSTKKHQTSLILDGLPGSQSDKHLEADNIGAILVGLSLCASIGSVYDQL